MNGFIAVTFLNLRYGYCVVKIYSWMFFCTGGFIMHDFGPNHQTMEGAWILVLINSMI